MQKIKYNHALFREALEIEIESSVSISVCSITVWNTQFWTALNRQYSTVLCTQTLEAVEREKQDLYHSRILMMVTSNEPKDLLTYFE